MDYRSKILEFMKTDIDGTGDFIGWVKTFPEMQQVELMREMNKMTIEMAAEKEWNITDYIPTFEKSDEKLNTLEDVILSQRLMADLINMLDDNKAKLKTGMIDNIQRNKIYIISGILNNSPDAEEMKELAKKMIETEKRLGVYNPKNWEDIE